MVGSPEARENPRAIGIPVVALGNATATAFSWKLGAAPYVAVVVKVVLALVPAGVMKPLPSEPIVTAERHHMDNPTRSVKLTSELAPFLPRADIIVTGFAHAPESGPTPLLV